MQYGLIGEKLTHSFSREIHNRLFDYDYVLKEIEPNLLDRFMRERDFKAINVTIPYKQAVMPYLYSISEQAQAIGAVNTVVNKDGKLYGYNTDFAGMCALIVRNGIEINNKKVLILGSGGTSKTAYAVAHHLGAAAVLRVSRSGRDGGITYKQAYESHSDAQIIINTTPCGMYPHADEIPIDINRFPALSGVVDAIYNPLHTSLVTAAQNRGIKACGGLYMLVAQAAFAAEHFLDTKVPREKIDQIFATLENSKKNIVLTGMPGSGKTTVGKLLAESLQMEFVDTDELIVKHEGREITEIFACLGEAGFRDIETRVIKEVSARQHCIISTGGGAVLRQENIDALHANGRIYFLDRPLESIVATDDRPLSSNRADLEKRYRERYDIYCNTADVKIDNSLTAQTAASKIKEDFTL